jgi:voltage-gated potassium channel
LVQVQGAHDSPDLVGEPRYLPRSAGGGNVAIIQYTVDFFHSLFASLGDQKVRPYLVAAANLIVIGTIFYILVEGWEPLDAAYFCVITLATVGFGDITPVTPWGKAFTMLYIIAGLGVLSAFIGTLTRVSVERAQTNPRKRVFAHRKHRNESESHHTGPPVESDEASSVRDER